MAQLTKSQLLDKLAGASGMTKKDVAGFLETLAKTAYSEVKSHGEWLS